MKIIERLGEYIHFKGISLNSFDKAIGMSNGYIGKQIKNKASVGSNIIGKISCVYKDLNIEWLITGNGEMIKQDTETPNQPQDDKAYSLLLDRIEKLSNENMQLRSQIEKLKDQK